MRDPAKLRAFQLARQLALAVYEHTASFPKSEAFGLTSQMRRAGVSVGSSIVEGCSRHFLADYIRFLEIAYGSVRELEFQIDLAQKLKFFDAPPFDQLRQLACETGKVLNGLIRSLRDKWPAPVYTLPG